MVNAALRGRYGDCNIDHSGMEVWISDWCALTTLFTLIITMRLVASRHHFLYSYLLGPRSSLIEVYYCSHQYGHIVSE